MNVLPVITRELRVQARQPLTFRLRMLAVLALVATCGIFLWDSPHRQNIGGMLFALMHCVLFYAALLLVTFSAADSLSRERREGTLGLLCLTPLRATDIVIAKGLAHGLRALTLVLAVIPVFALPMLMGGVSGGQLVNSLLLLVSAIALALGAAFLASAWSRRWTRSQGGALMLVILGWVGLTMCVAALLFNQSARGNTNFGFRGGFDYSWLMGVSIVSGGISRWNWFGRPPAAASTNLLISAQVAGVALVWLLGCIWLAARHTKKVWREEPASARRQWVEQKLTTPVVGLQFYKHWMRRLLERNPVGWLERRSWQGRLVMWTWLAIVITVTTSTLGDSTLVRAFSSLQELLAWLLVLSFAATVAGSFRRERENGVLELLLISPLSARRIILGRLLGLWGQFLPAVVLFVFVWAYISQLLRHGVFSEIAGFLLTFATLPIIGLYFSLRCQSFIAAFLMTLITGVLLPSVFSKVIQFLLRGLVYDYTGAYAYEFNSIAWLLAQSLPILLALMAWTLTHSRLEQRRFSFERITA